MKKQGFNCCFRGRESLRRTRHDARHWRKMVLTFRIDLKTLKCDNCHFSTFSRTFCHRKAFSMLIRVVTIFRRLASWRARWADCRPLKKAAVETLLIYKSPQVRSCHHEPSAGGHLHVDCHREAYRASSPSKICTTREEEAVSFGSKIEARYGIPCEVAQSPRTLL